MPAMFDEKKAVAAQPAQRPPQAANRQSGNNNMHMKMINDYEERKEQRANAGAQIVQNNHYNNGAQRRQGTHNSQTRPQIR